MKCVAPKFVCDQPKTHCENCLYDIKVEIEKRGSADQRVALAESMEALERLYFLLQEEE